MLWILRNSITTWIKIWKKKKTLVKTWKSSFTYVSWNLEEMIKKFAKSTWASYMTNPTCEKLVIADGNRQLTGHVNSRSNKNGSRAIINVLKSRNDRLTPGFGSLIISSSRFHPYKSSSSLSQIWWVLLLEFCFFFPIYPKPSSR